eukprot:scaffold5708_cov72-Phaeocystis_antarctica.AAC.1
MATGRSTSPAIQAGPHAHQNQVVVAVFQFRSTTEYCTSSRRQSRSRHLSPSTTLSLHPRRHPPVTSTFLLAGLLRVRVAALGAALGCGTRREEAAPLHHRGVAEELDPALSPQRPQRAHRLLTLLLRGPAAAAPYGMEGT